MALWPACIWAQEGREEGRGAVAAGLSMLGAPHGLAVTTAGALSLTNACVCPRVQEKYEILERIGEGTFGEVRVRGEGGGARGFVGQGWARWVVGSS